VHDDDRIGIAANQDLWDKRVRAHLAFGLYPSVGVEAGTYELGDPDLAELGDVAGQRLVHLQCNAGADTLAWARRGAIVTGIDFSDVAITEARRLAAPTGIDATFVCADLYALPGPLGTFDIAYTSMMGVVRWLPDLDEWARVVTGLLVPGGRFYLHEIHPVAACLRDRNDHLEFGEDYFGDGSPIVFETTTTYYQAPDDFAAEPAWNTVGCRRSVASTIRNAPHTPDVLSPRLARTAVANRRRRFLR
jgi:SAM-dependent methyltransferase